MMNIFNLTDGTGSIRCVSFDDMAPQMEHLFNGRSYVFTNLYASRPRESDTGVEGKITKSTNFQVCGDLDISFSLSSLDDCLAKPEGGDIHFEAVVHATTSNDQNKLTIVFADSTGVIEGIVDQTQFETNIVSLFKVGSVVLVSGRRSKFDGIFFVGRVARHKDETMLANWYSMENKNIELPASKRLRSGGGDAEIAYTSTKISLLRSMRYNSFVTLQCVVSSCTPYTTSLPNGTLKRTFSVVDEGMETIQVTAFDSLASSSWEIGTILTFSGIFTYFQRPSLKTNKLTILEDSSHPLVNWWKSNSDQMFGMFSRPPASVSEVNDFRSNARVDVIGIVKTVTSPTSFVIMDQDDNTITIIITMNGDGIPMVVQSSIGVLVSFSNCKVVSPGMLQIYDDSTISIV